MARNDIGGREVGEIRAFLGDYPVMDAPSDMLVYVNLSDQELGVPGDPNNCMFSLACKRAFGSHGVLFYPTVAYVDMLHPEDNSRRVIFRFRLPIKTRRRLERFEWDRSTAIEGTFLLKAPTKGHTLAAQRKRNKAHRQRVKAGTQPDPKHQQAGKKAAKTRAVGNLLGIRSGTGQVHTSV